MSKDLRRNGSTLDEVNISSRVFASILIGLSGFVLYADKLFYHLDIEFSIPDKFSESGMTFETFVWLWSQTLSPILLIIGALLKPYRYLYGIPLFCYGLQAYTLAFDSQDFTYTGIYAIGTTFLVFAIIELLKRYFSRSLRKELEQMREEVFENIKNVR